MHAPRNPGPIEKVSEPAGDCPRAARRRRTVVVWHRNDLRTTDNEALAAAARLRAAASESEGAGSAAKPSASAVSANAQTGPSEGSLLVLPLYCFDSTHFSRSDLGFEGWGFGSPKISHRRARFVLDSVLGLKSRLRSIGSDLLVKIGRPDEVLPAVLSDLGVHDDAEPPLVIGTREVGTEEQLVERAVAAAIAAPPLHGELQLHWNASSLYHVDDLAFGLCHGIESLSQMPDNFTAFRAAVMRECKIRAPLPALAGGALGSCAAESNPELHTQFQFEPTVQQLPWPSLQAAEAARAGATRPARPADGPSAFRWRGGEETGLARVERYLFGSNCVATYQETRNGLLGADYSSKMAPWLACGALSPRYVSARLAEYEKTVVQNESTRWVRYELTWRDFFRFFALKHGRRLFQLRGTDPKLSAERAAKIQPWRTDCQLAEAWRQGQCGVPFVDANMRELAATGWMSNRGRQNVASFLVYELQLDWRIGAEHFEHMLLDYDCASNWGNWVHAAAMDGGRTKVPPRLNRFNILKQARDYDPGGEYTLSWVPELRDLPAEFVQCPWKAPRAVQTAAGCVVGVDYPLPLGRRHGKKNMPTKVVEST